MRGFAVTPYTQLTQSVGLIVALSKAGRPLRHFLDSKESKDIKQQLEINEPNKRHMNNLTIGLAPSLPLNHY